MSGWLTPATRESPISGVLSRPTVWVLTPEVVGMGGLIFGGKNVTG
jgi:hypothetical protein